MNPYQYTQYSAIIQIYNGVRLKHTSSGRRDRAVPPHHPRVTRIGPIPGLISVRGGDHGEFLGCVRDCSQRLYTSKLGPEHPAQTGIFDGAEWAKNLALQCVAVLVSHQSFDSTTQSRPTEAPSHYVLKLCHRSRWANIGRVHEVSVCNLDF